MTLQPHIVRRVTCPVCGYVTRACKAAVSGLALVAQHRTAGARNDRVPYCEGTHAAIPLAADEVVG